MNENHKIDDLFRANSDYLADQPHRDFDPEAFWQQLRPEMAQPKRKTVGRWWAAAAVIALTLLAGGVWWMQPGRVASGKSTAKLPVVVSPKENTKAAPYLEPAIAIKEEIAKSRTNATKKPRATYSKYKEKTTPPVLLAEDSLLPKADLFADKDVFAAPALPEPKVEVTASETSKLTPPNPRYRIVHLNEIQPHREQKSQSRPQVALRVGVAGASAPVLAEPKIQLTIPINN